MPPFAPAAAAGHERHREGQPEKTGEQPPHRLLHLRTKIVPIGRRLCLRLTPRAVAPLASRTISRGSPRLRCWYGY